MAWIESHQSLLGHPKTLAAQRLLETDRFKLIGHLHALWWWALDIADEEGVLPINCNEAVIAASAGWPIEQCHEFVEALTNAGKPGFVERHRGRYVLHDWAEYGGKLQRERREARERMARIRSERSRTNTSERSRPGTSERSRTNPEGSGVDKRTRRTVQNTTQDQEQDKEDEDARAVLPLVRAFERCFGRLLSPMEIENIKALEDEHPRDRIDYALREAAELHKTVVRYVQRVCERVRDGGGEATGKPQRSSGNSRDAEGRELTAAERNELERSGALGREPTFVLDP